MSQAEKIADAVQSSIQPVPKRFDLLNGTQNRATFTERTSEYSTEEAVWFLCRPDRELANEVMGILEKHLESIEK